ncbi:TPA: 4Fe-4S dicluster domain-containing protein [Candidatus Bathyarchaeota archaeon]|nr:4Fe-4S dicluster domain-containing protein [Candidatus Bathyarchaeota archaeon]
MGKIIVKEEVCIGCRLCEVYCVVEHSRSKDIIKAFKKEEKRPLPRILVEERGATSFALQCRHCEDAPCVESCITGAMRKEDGRIVCNVEKCVGCWTCIMVCPYGVIKREEINGRKTASKCDLCPDRDIPACVANCPNEALIWVRE